ncbi:MAG: replication initiation protein [Sulfitobacter sp.]|uniref:replication initiation protein n=1 Tax=Sulfitobacter sp. TaxID=1903071 RepID=UPI00329771CA
MTPAMVSAVWEIAAALDEQRVPAHVETAHWLHVPTSRLRGEGSRSDNVWLRECLDRLTGVKLSGEHKGDPWGAVVLAEWRIVEGGAMAHLLIPPAGIHALRSPASFAKIEAHAAHRLTGHGRQLYALLADKKRLGRPYWTYTLDELRALMGVDDKKAYRVWGAFARSVLQPAISAINDYGTVHVTMTPERRGRSIHAVRFDWQWKDPHDATETALETERHSATRRRAQDAPPMIEAEKQPTEALDWWHGLTSEDRQTYAAGVSQVLSVGGKTFARADRDIAADAYKSFLEAGVATSSLR